MKRGFVYISFPQHSRCLALSGLALRLSTFRPLAPRLSPSAGVRKVNSSILYFRVFPICLSFINPLSIEFLINCQLQTSVTVAQEYSKRRSNTQMKFVGADNRIVNQLALLFHCLHKRSSPPKYNDS